MLVTTAVIIMGRGPHVLVTNVNSTICRLMGCAQSRRLRTRLKVAEDRVKTQQRWIQREWCEKNDRYWAEREANRLECEREWLDESLVDEQGYNIWPDQVEEKLLQEDIQEDGGVCVAEQRQEGEPVVGSLTELMRRLRMNMGYEGIVEQVVNQYPHPQPTYQNVFNQHEEHSEDEVKEFETDIQLVEEVVEIFQRRY
jgi:hypothetical protein